MAEGTEDEDDPVVDEVPVYLNHLKGDHLNRDLYILQFPTRQATARQTGGKTTATTTTTLLDTARLDVFFKPRTASLRFDFPLDATSTDEVRARAYARQGGGEGEGDDGDEDDALKIKLTSTKVPHQSSYMAVLLSDDGKSLHLTSVPNTLQLRPSLDHVDKLQARQRAQAAATAAATTAAATSSLANVVSAAREQPDDGDEVAGDGTATNTLGAAISGTEDEGGLSEGGHEAAVGTTLRIRPSTKAAANEAVVPGTASALPGSKRTPFGASKTLTVGLAQTDASSSGARMALLKPLRDAEAESYQRLVFHTSDSSAARTLKMALQGA